MLSAENYTQIAYQALNSAVKTAKHFRITHIYVCNLLKGRKQNLKKKKKKKNQFLKIFLSEASQYFRWNSNDCSH